MGPAARYCKLCGVKLPVGNETFCRKSCQQAWVALLRHHVEGSDSWRASLDRSRARALAKNAGFEAPPPGKQLWGVSRKSNPVGRTPDGEDWQQFLDGGWAERLYAGECKPKDVVAGLGFSFQKVSRLYDAYVTEQQRLEAAEKGVLPPRAQQCLGDFSLFRKTYFTDHAGDPYIQARHHEVWTRAAMNALETGGQQMVLAPPRHGKSELLIHLCLWLILRDPNIRIIWIGGNNEIAKQSLGAVQDEFENNEKLRADFLLAGEDFRPSRNSGKEWTRERFTVATRFRHGIKSPTMVAIGKGGKFLSRDADIIIGDDIVDDDATKTPSARADLLQWWTTQVVSRKEANTAMFLIGSRQHHDDLYGSMLQNQMWQSIVESAHSPECDLPDHEFLDSEHMPATCEQCKAHVDCVLWPDKRPFTFLQAQRISYDNDTLFEMVYNNLTRPAGALFVTMADIERSYDLRQIGQFPQAREEMTLIAGLDPSASNDQAAFLWAYDVQARERWAIDLDVQKGGGLPGAREIIQRWWELYHCGWWLIEKNNYQEAIIHDAEIRDFCARRNIRLTPTFTTGKNKHDPAMGVTALLATFKADPPITHLPGGTEAARAKMSKYAKQLINFDGLVKSQRSARPGSDDLVMASWFPELKFRTLALEHATQAVNTSPDSTMYGPTLGHAYQKLAV